VAIAPIGSASALTNALAVAPTSSPASSTTAIGGTGATGNSFGDMVGNAINSLQTTQTNADHLANQAATGQLQDVQQYMVASTEANLSTELTVAVRNKAVDAFNEIMRMSV
jgi:flagellar hook-basal body complex protein FliE